MFLLVTVTYAFDWNKAWADSYTKQTKQSILEVEHGSGPKFHKELLEALHHVDSHIEFNKTQSPQPMFQDTVDGDTFQTGWIYRCSMEDSWKKYLGDAWVSIYGVVEPYDFGPAKL